MNPLVITPTTILFFSALSLIIYVSAFRILIKNKSGLISYLILLFIPVLGSLGIILSNYSAKNK